MCKIKRLLYIHIILIYFTFIYTQTINHSYRRQAYASEVTTKTPTSTPPPTPASTINSDIFYTDDTDSEERAKFIKNNYKQIAKDHLFKFKGNPTTAAQTKLYVPRAMLEQYMEFRDTVREFIPDDRDFYGKINIGDLDVAHENFWGAVYNKHGSYDIEVDLAPKEEGSEDRKFNYKGKASHIAYVPTGRDPENVPPNMEHYLPPHSRTVQSQSQFISVHLHFNLSQEIYASPTAAEDLKGAELHLAREKLYDCEPQGCEKKPVPFFNNNNNNDNTDSLNQKIEHSRSDFDSGASDRLHKFPRYQKIYVLSVHGYNQYKEPITKIYSTKRIDTRQTTPIIFNIYHIVKSWLDDPKKNYGIIVRVTNDDEAYEQAVRMKKIAKHVHVSPTSKRDINSAFTNASNINIDSSTPDIDEVKVVEHVRLKRGFRSSSDNDDAWRRNQPSILIYTKDVEPTKHHVKRHNEKNEDDTDSMQADDPDVTQRNYEQSSQPTTMLNVGQVQQQAADAGLGAPAQTDKPIGAHLQTGTVSSATRSNSSHGGRRGPQPSRGSGSARSPGQSGGSKPKQKGKQSVRQPEKCSKRSMAINFDEVGWSSWIIAPHSFYANYCAGDCTWPLSDIQNATNHAIIQAIYHSVGRVIPKSCCAPVKLGRMAILYQLDGIVQMRQYDDMIVEACGCL